MRFARAIFLAAQDLPRGKSLAKTYEGDHHKDTQMISFSQLEWAREKKLDEKAKKKQNNEKVSLDVQSLFLGLDGQSKKMINHR